MKTTPLMNKLVSKTYRFANVEGRSKRLGEAAVRRVLQTYYLLGNPPWDSGITPPELVNVAEGDEALPPGRALDLGCGTGTNTIYLARRGWDAVGVDLVERAVRQAKRKADAAGVQPRFLRGDVTALENSPIGGDFSLFFDLSCYCGIPVHRRDSYVANITRLARRDATLLLFGYGSDSHGTHVTVDEMRTRFVGWELLEATPGNNAFPAWWFTMRRVASP